MNNTMVIDSDEKVDKIDFDEAQEATIDLTEIIDYDKQTKVHTVVTGVENYVSNGKLDNITAMYLNAKVDRSTLDPLGGSVGSRFGGEGFFSSALKMLENAILAVIRFIKKIIIWIVDKVKTVFGLKPSDRQAAVIAEKLPELKNQMKSWLTALGFPAHLVDLDKFLEDMPKGRSNAQIRFMASKLVSQEAYITRFAEIPPLIFTVQKVIGDGARRAAEAKKKFKAKLDFIVKNAKTSGFDWDGEGGQLRELMLKVIKSLNYTDVIPELNKVLELVVGQIIDPNDDFSKNSIAIAEQLTKSVVTATEQANKPFLAKIEQILAKTTVENLDRLDGAKSGITDAMRDLFDMVDASELTKISGLQAATGDARYMAIYKEMVEATQIFTNYAKVLVEVTRISSNTFSSLSSWYKDTVHFMLSCVANDVAAVSEHMLKAKQRAIKEGRSFNVNMDVNGIPNLVLTTDAEAQTAMEKVADVSDVFIKNNLLNITDSVNTFSRATGGGKIL